MKEKKANYLCQGLSYLFVLFWAYCFFSKVLFFKTWHAQMHNQVFGEFLSQLLQYLLPVLFLALVILLFIQNTHLLGLYFSIGMLFAFNGYISLVWLNAFDRIPCSCAAIFPGLSWLQQFLINTIALLLLGLAIFLNQKERRWAKA